MNLRKNNNRFIILIKLYFSLEIISIIGVEEEVEVVVTGGVVVVTDGVVVVTDGVVVVTDGVVVSGAIVVMNFILKLNS
jgi:hypothetical protein